MERPDFVSADPRCSVRPQVKSLFKIEWQIVKTEKSENKSFADSFVLSTVRAIQKFSTLHMLARAVVWAYKRIQHDF